MNPVETAHGRVDGNSGPHGLEFLGLPYAQAPRWAPPTEPVSWFGTRPAQRPGPAAPQPARPAALFTHGELPGSDEAGCLTLNVYTPALRGSRPVFVWIHGGGFAIGHGSASLYNGAQLAATADVVVVTLNYRLGSLGWLGHPELAASPGDPFANWGLLDQIAALRWVAANIAAFGGDPRRVTVGGQSAGALSALDLLVAPAAEGLFSRAVLQSPPMADVGQSVQTAVDWAQALAARGPGGLQGLRELDAEGVVRMHEELLAEPAFAGTRGGALPTVDGVVLPLSPADAPAASPTVSVLAGHNAQEGTFFFRCPWRPSPPPERIPGIVGHLAHTEEPELLLSQFRERAERLGAPSDPLSLLVDIATEEMVAGPLARWSAARAQALGDAAPVYRYRVDHPGGGAQLGATHTVEVPLLFSTFADGGPGDRLGGQAPGAPEVAAQITAAWARFLHDGDPGWSSLASGEDALAVFGRPNPAAADL